MKAIVNDDHRLPITDPRALYATELPAPVPGPRDLLVRNRAIAVNPVDYKVRSLQPTTVPRVLGWDASGVVEAVGSAVTLFKAGDEVYYAGAIDRPGCYAELSLVDERIAARKPRSLDHAQATALPLTSITAWELLFDRLQLPEDGGEGETLLIVGAAGGVGSILTQLAARLTRLNVIGTASRPQTAAWARELGAHHVIDHSRPLAGQFEALSLPPPRYVACLTHAEQHFSQLVEVLMPQGRLALIEGPQSLEISAMKTKSLSLHWEFMFTRSLMQTPDMQRQHELLQRVADLIDAGTLRTTVGEHFGAISADNLRRAHALMESHSARGKIVLEGF